MMVMRIVNLSCENVYLTVNTEVVEPVMPAPLSLPALFYIRPVDMVTEDEDDRLSNIYWLSTPMGDESDHEQDLVCTLPPVYTSTCVLFHLYTYVPVYLSHVLFALYSLLLV